MRISDAQKNRDAMDSTVKEMVPLTSLFDANSDTHAMKECMESYSRQISSVRILVGNANKDIYKPASTRETILLARRYGIPTSAKPESSRSLIIRGVLPIYLDLCAEMGIKEILFKKDSLQSDVSPRELVALADDRDLDIQYEIEDLTFFNQPTSSRAAMKVIDNAMEWLDSGAVRLVSGVTKRSPNEDEETQNVVNITYGDLLASAFGLHTVMFKAPTEVEQQALLNYFGAETHLCDVPFNEVGRVEEFRENVSASIEFKDTSKVHRPAPVN